MKKMILPLTLAAILSVPVAGLAQQTRHRGGVTEVRIGGTRMFWPGRPSVTDFGNGVRSYNSPYYDRTFFYGPYGNGCAYEDGNWPYGGNGYWPYGNRSSLDQYRVPTRPRSSSLRNRSRYGFGW